MLLIQNSLKLTLSSKNLILSFITKGFSQRKNTEQTDIQEEKHLKNKYNSS